MEKKYFIWSNEHQAWWRWTSCGYTKDRRLAGQYSLAEAESICQNANFHQDEDEVPNEAIVPVPERP